MRRSERQRLLWERSVDHYAAAFKAASEGWAQAQAEREQLQAEKKALLWKIDLLVKACEGGKAMRQKLKRENDELKARFKTLEEENRKLNETLDIISAENNPELMKKVFAVGE